MSNKDIYDAIRQGVNDAFWQMITDATDAPCADFYDTIREAVKEAISENSNQ